MSLPRMSWHIGDYHKDTGHLRAAGHGAYFLLCMHYWATGCLPDDDKQLAAIARMSDKEWKAHRPLIEPLFKLGKWKHKRIEEELELAQKKYEARANAGQKGGNATANAKQTRSNATAKTHQPITDNPNQTEEAKNASSVVPLSAKRGSRLADDWQPSDADLKFAGEKGMRLHEIDRQAARFRDYWTNKPGKAGVMLDWSKTWRNWIRTATENTPRGNGNGAKPSVMDAAERLIAAEEARIGCGTGPLLDLTAESSPISDEAPRALPER